MTSGSPHALPSWHQWHRERKYGAFVAAFCHAALIIPCWIALLPSLSPACGGGSNQRSNITLHFVLMQYAILVALILAETASGCLCFKAYFTAVGVAVPTVVGVDIISSSSAVTAGDIDTVKQTFEAVGTALFILSAYPTRATGVAVLLLAVPLAYESVRRALLQRVMYVVASNGDDDGRVDHETLKFWMQAAALGSTLVVGVPGASVTTTTKTNRRRTDTVSMAHLLPCVTTVVADAPAKADLLFLERLRIDYVVTSYRQAKALVTDEVVNAMRVIAIGKDGVARLVESKVEGKKD